MFSVSFTINIAFAQPFFLGKTAASKDQRKQISYKSENLFLLLIKVCGLNF